LQIDSINVVERAPHLTPVSAAWASHDRDVLWRAYNERHELMEYWAHAACFLPVDAYRCFAIGWKAASPGSRCGRLERQATPLPGRRARGSCAGAARWRPRSWRSPGERETPTGGRGGRRASCALCSGSFAAGRLVVGERRRPGKALRPPGAGPSPAVPGSPGPAAGRGATWAPAAGGPVAGVATAGDLMAYYMIRGAEARATGGGSRRAGGVGAGGGEGWPGPAFRHPGAGAPRRAVAATLLWPLRLADSGTGSATERLFGLRLPHRDLYPPGEAHLRLLRAPLPDGGAPGGPGGPQGRSAAPGAPGARGFPRGGGGLAAGGAGPGRRVGGSGWMAGAGGGRGGRARRTWPAVAPGAPQPGRCASL